MLRIAYVCADPGVPVFGTKGASVHVQEIIRAFLRIGHHVTLFATRRGGEAPADLRRVCVHPLPALPKGEPALRERSALAANNALQQTLAKHGHFDVVYERYSLWSHAAMEHARLEGIPGVLEVNAPLIHEQAKHRSLVYRSAAEKVAERVFSGATSLIAVSSGVAAYLQSVCPTAGSQLHVIPNGVDPARFPASQFASPTGKERDNPFTIGFLGTLKPWHGLDVLMDAFARLHAKTPDIRLLIVGDGPERKTIERAAARHGMSSSVQLTGAVAPEGVPDWLHRMDVGVAPYPASPDFYFSPLKIHEYMAAALPVVTSRIGELERFVEDGVTGLLYPPDDSAAMADALQQLRGDPDLCLRLGMAGRSKVLQNHGWDAVVTRILEQAEFDSRANGGGRTA